MITIEFNGHIWKIKFENIDLTYRIVLTVKNIRDIIEHEETIPDKKLIEYLVSSFKKNGFLNPLLVTEFNSKYTIADGTHRLISLQKISEEFNKEICALLYVIKPKQLKRSSWVLEFKKSIPIEEIKSAGFSLIPFTTKEFDNQYASLLKGEFQGIIRVNGQFYKIIKDCKDRYDFLKSVKDVDTILGHYDNLSSVDYEKEMAKNLAILVPPVDEKGDMRLLIENKELRRKKGSKTDVDLRPLFFGVPIQEFLQEEEKCIKTVAEKIDYLVNNNKLVFIKPPLILGKMINPINYYTIMMKKDVFFEYNYDIKIDKNKIIEKYSIL
ncbi:MAG: hypothetical protein ACTSQY_07265 [Candidatus Odinarchaeia archaeon]